MQIQQWGRNQAPDQMMMELMAVEKHLLTPPSRGVHKAFKNNSQEPNKEILKTLCNMTFPPREPPKTTTPAKAFPDPRRHQPPTSYADTVSKQVEVSHKSGDKPKRNRFSEPTPTRAPSPVQTKACETAPSPKSVLGKISTENSIRRPSCKASPSLTPIEDKKDEVVSVDEHIPIPDYMLPELMEDTPKAAYTKENNPAANLKPEEPHPPQPEVNIPMDILDAKVREILAQVSLEEELPHDTPNVTRYMGLFSPSKENRAEVETVEDTPKTTKPINAPLSPLIRSAPVDNPPMETEEDWIHQATPDEVKEVQILKDLIADEEKPICLPKNGSSMRKLVEVTNAAKKLLEETKIEMTWAQFCKYCPPVPFRLETSSGRHLYKKET
ncbi:hypothetical protein DSO57_1025968 [Entomophthora muscae]|uniref:Uncharacterized protein n=1 Tax=Entomophthora muscae TaxID=34485 RepID=A0ACC2TDG0_9FUNG|nr:hypothetical protein DSO57_1025968 [Entomophthora muscae]